MVRRLCRAPARAEYQTWDQSSPRAPSGAVPLEGDPNMTWQTPAATDLRFGFEITMYVAAR